MPRFRMQKERKRRYKYRYVNISTPVSVTRRVCSNWAESFPSLVVAVQLSGLYFGIPVSHDTISYGFREPKHTRVLHRKRLHKSLARL